MKQLIGGKSIEIDLYSPHDFSGLDDCAHFGNFQKALSEHEIVAYDGHCMLGASDFWARPSTRDSTRSSCTAAAWATSTTCARSSRARAAGHNLDMMSSVVEVSADANAFAAPVVAKILSLGARPRPQVLVEVDC